METNSVMPDISRYKIEVLTVAPGSTSVFIRSDCYESTVNVQMQKEKGKFILEGFQKIKPWWNDVAKIREKLLRKKANMSNSRDSVGKLERMRIGCIEIMHVNLFYSFSIL